MEDNFMYVESHNERSVVVPELSLIPHLKQIYLLQVLVLPCIFIHSAGNLYAAEKVTQISDDRLNDSAFGYGEKGLQYQPVDSATDLWLGLRFQTRYDNFKGDISSLDVLRGDQDSGTELRRGRIKGGGKLWADWFDVYSEYDFKSETLLDYRATATYNDWLNFRVGQWKSEFNRERIDSSGKQQLVERSIANYWFTIDRQTGVALSPRLYKGSRHDMHLWLELLTGHGRGAGFQSGDGLLLGRVQLNPVGEELPFSQSDLKRRQRPLTSFAVAAAAGDSPYTRFSSSGGGNLPGYQPGDFRLRQLMIESAAHYRGMGWQQELHWKEVKNRSDGSTRKIWGGYAQVGSFINEWWPPMPAPLELVARVAYVDPDTPDRSDHQWEYTIGANWFFNGHRNKLTLDYSLLDFEEGTARARENRLRLQWELSL
jgi:hypothetical protein